MGKRLLEPLERTTPVEQILALGQLAELGESAGRRKSAAGFPFVTLAPARDVAKKVLRARSNRDGSETVVT